MSSVFQDAIRQLLSPINDLLDDSSVSEVMINGPDEIFVEKSGLVTLVPNKFPDEEALMASMRAIAQSVGRVIDADNPRLDARLPDGSRIAVVIPPMAKKWNNCSYQKVFRRKIRIKRFNRLRFCISGWSSIFRLLYVSRKKYTCFRWYWFRKNNNA